MAIELDGEGLNLGDFAQVTFGGREVVLSASARERMAASRSVVERRVAEGEPTYGVNTGFGDLSGVQIPAERLRDLQRNLLLSHAAGVGEPLAEHAVRGMLLLRANALAKGLSGVREAVVERLLYLLNEDLLPIVPSRGSVGASGDLAPLAHLALPVIGEGRLLVEGEVAETSEALGERGVEPLVLEAKEGLALINGTQAMASLLALACLAAKQLVKVADLCGALSADALRSTDAAFDARLHAARPHIGQGVAARNLWSLLQGSEIRESHREGDVRIQDPYSVRCMPQVHGAVRDSLDDAVRRLEIEFNAATDNPLIFAEDDVVLSGGNFHGEPVALAADSLCLALAELASISERRVEKLTNPNFSGLPPFLVEDAGVQSGFMIAQVTAAALVSENKVLSHPASIDSIPTSADKEDHVSMGMGAVLKLGQVVGNVRQVLAIEALCGAQGIDLLRPMVSSEVLEGFHRALRERVPRWREDREMSRDLAAAEAFLQNDVGPWTDRLD